MARKRKAEGDGNSSAPIGHNSQVTGEAKKKLEGFVSEIERVDADVRELTSERGLIYKAAKEQGFDTKALREVIRLRRMTADKRKERETLVEAYMHALGMLSDTPLGRAAMQREFSEGAAKTDDEPRVAEPAGS